MRARFLAAGQAAPDRALGIDGAIPGCRAVYSHWPGAPPPDEIAADTATAILLRASLAPERWLDGFAVCVNDHCDADGLLAAAIACRPERGRRHGPLLVGAAAYGDFGSWPGEQAARLALRLHGLMAEERGAGPGWEQRCYDRVVEDLDALIAESQMPDAERQAQIDQILRLRHALMGDPSGWPLRIVQDAGFTLLRGTWCHGHHDAFGAVHLADDCPPWAIDGLVPASHHRLLGLDQGPGTAWWFEAPPHSWAHTVRLPRVAWPDCSALAASLNATEPGPCRWLAGDEARRFGYTCLLVSSDGAGRPAPSGLDEAAILTRVRQLPLGEEEAAAGP